MLMRKNFTMNDNGFFRLCNEGLLESSDHLFWYCNFSRQCWGSINITLEDNLELPQMIATSRSNIRRPLFFEVFATASRSIWKQKRLSFLIMSNLLLELVTRV
jgi:hypothetical protein